jgi:RHS repeat-associated protein
VGLSSGTSFTTTNWGSWSTTVNWVDVQVADTNGDGRSDLLGRISGTGAWWTSQATGSSFSTVVWSTYSNSITWVDSESLAGSFYHRGVLANYGYDNAGRLTTLTYQQIGGAGSSLATYAYGYDTANRLTSETLNNGTPTSYGYDTTNQLTTVTNASGTTTYGYDLNGNRTNTNYVTGGNNELTADGTYSYTYDQEGNLITKTNKSTLEQWTFGYDNLNHMTTAIDKNSSGTTLTYATYMYDVFGNRIEKDVWTQSGGSTTTTRMAYDGISIWADLSSGNALLARYLRGDQIDNLIARIVTSGSTPAASWYLPDRLGSIRNITDANGNPIDTITYDGFGNVTNETSASNGDRWKFTGREFDTETGLQFNRARYYAPFDGRWTTQDPLGFAGRDTNLYRYVGNQSPNATDPMGIFTLLKKRIRTKGKVADLDKRFFEEMIIPPYADLAKTVKVKYEQRFKDFTIPAIDRLGKWVLKDKDNDATLAFLLVFYEWDHQDTGERANVQGKEHVNQTMDGQLQVDKDVPIEGSFGFVRDEYLKDRVCAMRILFVDGPGTASAKRHETVLTIKGKVWLEGIEKSELKFNYKLVIDKDGKVNMSFNGMDL